MNFLYDNSPARPLAICFAGCLFVVLLIAVSSEVPWLQDAESRTLAALAIIIGVVLAAVAH